MPEKELRVGSLFSGIPSEEWTPDSLEPDTDTSSSANPTPGVETCSPPDGPECPSTTTYAFFDPARTLMPDGTIMENWEEHEIANAITSPSGTKSPVVAVISSAAASPAKTSQSPDNAEDSPANAPASSSSSPESSTLFDPDGYSSRTFQVSSLATAVGTSESCLERWPTSGTAWAGGFSTHVSSECRSADGVCSSSEPALTEILQPPHDVPAKYSLSARAAQGILRRAQKRGRELPPHLLTALKTVASSAANT